VNAPDVDAPRLSQGEGRPLLRFLLAASITGLAALLAAGSWIVGQTQYLEDYCHTRIEPPEASSPEALSGRPAYWDNPITVACEFDGFPTVYTTEPAPLFGALLLAGGVVAVAFIAFNWARPEKG
jgi:hypothetical protein